MGVQIISCVGNRYNSLTLELKLKTQTRNKTFLHLNALSLNLNIRDAMVHEDLAATLRLKLSINLRITKCLFLASMYRSLIVGLAQNNFKIDA